MLVPIEPMLFQDPQQEAPAGFWPRCGGELYRPGLQCLRCQGEEV